MASAITWPTPFTFRPSRGGSPLNGAGFVATNEARHRPGQARGDGSLGPVSRADHPVATCYTARSNAADLDLGSVRCTTSLRVREKHGLCAGSPRTFRQQRFTPSWPSPAPPQLDVARGVFCSNASNVHPPYAAHNSSGHDFHRTELYRCRV